MIVNAWVHVITNKSMGTCLCDLSIDDSMGTCYNVYINKTATEKAESTLNFKQYTCEGSESIPIVRKILKGLLSKEEDKNNVYDKNRIRKESSGIERT